MPEPQFLDRWETVRTIDKSNMLRLCERMPDFCRDALKRARGVEIHYKFPEEIIVAGMGGSAMGGELLKHWLHRDTPIPIEVCRDYVLPAYADENSLVICISYSGETEETLSAFVDAAKRDCMLVTITSGGHLKTFSQKLGVPHISIRSGLAPRAAIAYIFFPLIVLVEKLHVVKDVNGEVEETLRVLQKLSDENKLEARSESNPAKNLASAIEGTIPIIYGFRQYEAVAQRLKCQFNENSKIPSKFDVFSELNHNEVVGWEAPRSFTKTFSTLFLRDSLEPPELRTRIELTKEIVRPKVARILEIAAEGRCKLAKMLSTMYVGDFASIYLAVLRGVDPTPTKTIAHLKRELKKTLDMTGQLEKEVAKLG
jgi:glucose/mannose-6-phosphate isomerase